nr:glycosyltransferase [Desulfonatronum lacustre]
MLSGGGAERVMVTLANAFTNRGIGTDFVLSKAEGPYLKNISPKVRIIHLNTSRMLTSVLPLAKYIQKEQPQAMLTALRHANVIAILATKLANFPLRLVISERSPLISTRAYAKGFRTRVMPFLMRLFYPKAYKVVAVSQGVADDLVLLTGLPRERIQVIYNPIDAPRIEVLGKSPPEHPWFAPNQPPVVLGVGRLTPLKSFKTLINAFSKLRDRRSVRLVILGEGELRNELQLLIENLGLTNEIALPGFVDNPYAWMRAAKLFVLTSIWEGLPCALIEAMACGTSVVSTDCPYGPSEVLENERWGRLVPVGDTIALAEAMDSALNDPNPPDVRKRAADFSVNNAVVEYMKALDIN